MPENLLLCKQQQYNWPLFTFTHTLTNIFVTPLTCEQTHVIITLASNKFCTHRICDYLRAAYLHRRWSLTLILISVVRKGPQIRQKPHNAEVINMHCPRTDLKLTSDSLFGGSRVCILFPLSLDADKPEAAFDPIKSGYFGRNARLDG